MTSPASDPGDEPLAPSEAVPAPSGWRAALAEHLALLQADRLTWFAGLTAAALLTFSRYHASTGEYRRVLAPRTADVGGPFVWVANALFGKGAATDLVHRATATIPEYLYWFWGSALLFFVVPLVLAALTPGVRVRELGAGLGDWRYGLKATGLLYLVMLPFVVGASFTPAFANHYPMAKAAAGSWWSLVSYELGYAAYFVGWEFLYRGLLCVGLFPRLGAGAIVLHAIPFAVMHAGKPEAEAYGSIVAAIALGVVAVRARSFWYGAFLHALIATTMDALALAQTGRWPKS